MAWHVRLVSTWSMSRSGKVLSTCRSSCPILSPSYRTGVPPTWVSCIHNERKQTALYRDQTICVTVLANPNPWRWLSSPSELWSYSTIRDAILMCARKLTWVSLIYRMEPYTEKWKQNITKEQKTDMLRSIGTQSGESVESVLTHTHGRGQKSVQKLEWKLTDGHTWLITSCFLLTQSAVESLQNRRYSTEVSVYACSCDAVAQYIVNLRPQSA